MELGTAALGLSEIPSIMGLFDLLHQQKDDERLRVELAFISLIINFLLFPLPIPHRIRLTINDHFPKRLILDF